jgi:hypothetical protein
MEAPTLNIQVGRLRSRADGLWEILGPDGELLAGPNEEGLTKEQATLILDEIDLRVEVRDGAIRIREERQPVALERVFY